MSAATERGEVNSVVNETPGQRAREALARHAWGEAYELMAEADQAGGLAPEDLEVLAQSAWWVGRQDTAREAWERAYTLHAKAGDKLAAANAAAQLAFNLLGAGLPSVLNGWVHRAERLLQGASEQPVHGLLAVVHGMTAFTSGDLDSAAAAGRRALELGTAFGVPDLQAMGLHLEGRALVAKGRVEEGMALLDEAAAAAVSGELSPQVTGRVYCSTVSACWGVADYRRASEWTDAAERWCQRRSINGFPGVCRLHRAQIHKLRGMWREAEAEALLACKELPAWFPLDLGQAMAEIGEIRLRSGDLAGAEEAFLQANDAGHDPNPGLALLLLAKGDLQAAATTLRDALDNPRGGSFETPPGSDLQRANLLPAQVEISLAVGDLDSARAAADELEQIAETCGVAAMRASAGWTRGAVQLATGRPSRPSRASGAAPPCGLSWTPPMRPPGPGWAWPTPTRPLATRAERRWSTGPPWPPSTGWARPRTPDGPPRPLAGKPRQGRHPTRWRGRSCSPTSSGPPTWSRPWATRPGDTSSAGTTSSCAPNSRPTAARS
jgi:tetratricopeptide (TPR) repeat protein